MIGNSITTDLASETSHPPRRSDLRFQFPADLIAEVVGHVVKELPLPPFGLWPRILTPEALKK